MTAQAQLRQSWNGSVDGRLCGREQAKAWALREVWRSEGKRDYGLFEFVAYLKRNRRLWEGFPSQANLKRNSPLSESDRGEFPLKIC